MRIGIDARLYTQTGVGRYLKNLISELAIFDRENEYIVYLRSQEYDEVKISGNRWKKIKVDIPWHTIREQISLPQILLKDNLDVVHFPYFNVPIFYPKKYLLTIHDLIVDHFDTGRASTLPRPLYFIKRMGYKTSLTQGIKRASWITAISNTTKKEIIDHYGVSEDKITVTFDALDTKFMETAKKQKAKNYYDCPYILYVGNAYPHKNLERLIKAFKLLQKKEKVKLILAGDDKYFYPRTKKYAENLGIGNKVIFFGEADDRELVNLYSHCRCLVFPSLMEGFGLPNLEVIACGKLPVMSDIPVFHEIWGDSVNYFDPYNEGDIAAKILSTINLPKSDYQEKVENLKKHLDDFSWKKTAEETLLIYNRIYNA